MIADDQRLNIYVQALHLCAPILSTKSSLSSHHTIIILSIVDPSRNHCVACSACSPALATIIISHCLTQLFPWCYVHVVPSYAYRDAHVHAHVLPSHSNPRHNPDALSHSSHAMAAPGRLSDVCDVHVLPHESPLFLILLLLLTLT